MSDKKLYDFVSVEMPTGRGSFRLSAFKFDPKADPALALTVGQLEGAENVPVRMHSSCLTGDVFGSQRCDCGPQLEFAMDFIASHGCGVVIYLHQEGRGIGLMQKLKAYKLQEGGLDTVDANVALGEPVDCREYSNAVSIIRYLGINSIRLLTNNPEKRTCLESAGILVNDVVPVIVEPNQNNLRYLSTKRTRMGHAIFGA